MHEKSVSNRKILVHDFQGDMPLDTANVWGGEKFMMAKKKHAIKLMGYKIL